MGRYTLAYSSLSRRLVEVEILYRAAAIKEKKDAIGFSDEINALCRGAIVLLSSHLEGYVKELGEITLNAIHTRSVNRTAVVKRFFYHISKDLINEIKDTSDPERIAEKVFSFLASDLVFWERTGAFPIPLPTDRFNSGFSNPSYLKIVKYFNRFGYHAYRTDLTNILRANYTVTTNMVNHLVDVRNKIAHGDPTATKTPSDVRDMVRIIREYSRVTDSLFGSWCKANLCPIR